MNIEHPRRHPSRDWSDRDASFTDWEHDLDDRIHAILGRLSPGARVATAQEGRREFERRAADRQHRADMVDASHEVSAGYFARGGPAEAQAARQRIDRARQRAAQHPGSGWVGQEHMTDDELADWRAHAWPNDVQLPWQRTNDDVLER